MAGPAMKRWLVSGAVLLGLALGGLLLWSVLSKKSPHKVKAPKITLLTPAAPPPPPPPPPKFEKKPEPPKEQKEMKVDQPAPPKAAPQQAPELKMDGPAGDGPSGFAAGNITSEDLSKLGAGGGAGPGSGERGGLLDPQTSFASALKGEMQRYLAKQNALRRRAYSVNVSVVMGPDGRIQRCKLSTSSGDPELDQLLLTAIEAMPVFNQAPPAGMPQIRLRINSKS